MIPKNEQLRGWFLVRLTAGRQAIHLILSKAIWGWFGRITIH